MSLYRPQLLTSAGPLEEPEPDDGTPPARMSDGSLVPVGLCPYRVARDAERRARWGALRARPLHGGVPKAKSAKERL